MRVTTRALAGLLLGVAFTPAAHARAADVGFIDLPRLVTAHPLHKVLAQYDREIRALRHTQSVAGLQDAALSAAHSAASLQNDAASAASRAASIGARNPAGALAREQQGISTLLRSRQSADRKMAASTTQLVAETNANLQAYSGSIAERTQRAYSARQTTTAREGVGLRVRTCAPPCREAVDAAIEARRFAPERSTTRASASRARSAQQKRGSRSGCSAACRCRGAGGVSRAARKRGIGERGHDGFPATRQVRSELRYSAARLQ